MMSRPKTCEHCEHFLPNDQNGGGRPGGICRRYPPMPMLMQQGATVLGGATGGIGMAGVSPPVDADYTCGEWKDAKTLTLAG